MTLTTEVFTPTTPAHLTFVERTHLNAQLVDALRTPGKQVVVYGQSGSGKTTLLENKLRQLYENHITTRCTAASTFESIVLSAFDKLSPFYLESTESTKGRKVTTSLSSTYKTIQGGISSEWTDQERKALRRALPLQLTAERLAEFVGAAQCCWVLEDFHKVQEEERVKLAQVLKTFMDAAHDHRSVKIVAIGAVDTARQVVHYDPEMSNRVAEILVPLMSSSELMSIMEKGEELLNVSLGSSTKAAVASYSSGLAAVCHQLCLNLCLAAGINERAATKKTIGRSSLKNAIERYLSDSSDTLKSVWDAAVKNQRSRKYDNCKLILKALIDLPPAGATHAEILAQIRRKEPQYPSGNLTTYLKQLRSPTRRAILVLDPTSGRLTFSNPLYRAYGLLVLGTGKPTLSHLMQEVVRVLEESLDRARNT